MICDPFLVAFGSNFVEFVINLCSMFVQFFDQLQCQMTNLGQNLDAMITSLLDSMFVSTWSQLESRLGSSFGSNLVSYFRDIQAYSLTSLLFLLGFLQDCVYACQGEVRQIWVRKSTNNQQNIDQTSNKGSASFWLRESESE